MMLRTHIAFGLLFGILLWYFFGFDFSFVLVMGFAAFLPDIDLVLNRRWNLPVRHRTLTHSIWFLLAVTIATYVLFQSVTFALATFIGCLSHLLSDSLTITGVYWLWPIGDDGSNEGKYHLKWKINTGDKFSQKLIQSILFGVTGFLFLSKDFQINIFSMEGLISIVVLIAISYVLVEKLVNAIARFINKLGL
ncbi:MAG: metal-dependent hydrolase [Candidatus Aenigmatarchaeota archaeon]